MFLVLPMTFLMLQHNIQRFLQVLMFLSIFQNYQARLFESDAGSTNTVGTLARLVGNKKDVLSSSKFPSIQDTMEVVMLSNLVYSLKSCTSSDLPVNFPTNLSCEYYEEKKDGTQVAVIRSDEKNYISVVYAGTDSTVDVLYDADLKAVRLGPEGYPLVENKHVKVYGGFNEQVFGDGLYDRLLAFVSDCILNKYPTYRLIVTGHSLGGANSILTSVAFAIAFTSSNWHVLVENISVASPRTGTEEFRNFTNNLNNLSTWRLVLKDDIVPRLPPSIFYWRHPGHTIQMSTKGVYCYYLHYGDDKLGYAGVPFPWNDVPYIDPIYGCLNHHIQKYWDYVKARGTGTNLSDPFVSSFVTIKDQALLVEDDDDAENESEIDHVEIAVS